MLQHFSIALLTPSLQVEGTSVVDYISSQIITHDAYALYFQNVWDERFFVWNKFFYILFANAFTSTLLNKEDSNLAFGTKNLFFVPDAVATAATWQVLYSCGLPHCYHPLSESCTYRVPVNVADKPLYGIFH